MRETDTNTEELNVVAKVSKLETVIQIMNEKILELNEKIKMLESNQSENYDESSSSSAINSGNPEEMALSDEEIDESEIQDDKQYKCEHCDFKTNKETGIKIHKGIKHKNETVDSPLNPEYDNFCVEKMEMLSASKFSSTVLGASV